MIFKKYFICQEFGKIGRVQECIDLDQVFRGIGHQLLLESNKVSGIQVNALVKVINSRFCVHPSSNQVKERAKFWILSIQEWSFWSIHQYACVAQNGQFLDQWDDVF